jgi:hypothetical protein
MSTCDMLCARETVSSSVLCQMTAFSSKMSLPTRPSSAAFRKRAARALASGYGWRFGFNGCCLKLGHVDPRAQLAGFSEVALPSLKTA